ncbi:GNAT family N-acetyltransferase [Streptomyces sp. NBC_01477]|uniref:GNAT family N-acetyltransferase n=1 Tax=Streptomyces sp. NBC_01477 TaxID=2976015 RepID=UPI002E34FFA3|nr:GNAT family N-acetyltransferase [Streptomyces sp. NBC_01477]
MRYRTATRADEAALPALWATVFPGATAMAALWKQDPGRHRRTFVAEDGGRAVSVVHYLPRTIRSAAGRPEVVGCLGSVATHPDARGRGHVRRLLEAAVATMTADGCAWSLLFTGTPRVYESSGWRSFAAPGWSGPLALPPRAGPAAAPLTVRTALAADLPVLRALRDGFDAARPLTTVRSLRDWQRRVPVWYAPPAETLLAEAGGSGARPLGSAVLRHPSPDEAEIVEIALADGGGPDVARALLAAAAARARDRGATAAAVRLPPVPAVVEALPCLLAEATPAVTRFGMSRPVLAAPAEVTATVTAPGAVHWYGDSF